MLLLWFNAGWRCGCCRRRRRRRRRRQCRVVERTDVNRPAIVYIAEAAENSTIEGRTGG